MVQFRLNQTIETTEPTITVDAGLPAGRHRFQLVVIDDAGNRSQPAFAIVEVQSGTTIPTTPNLTVSPVSPIDPIVRITAPATPVAPVTGPVAPATTAPIASTSPLIRRTLTATTAPHALPGATDGPTSQPDEPAPRGRKPQKPPPKKPGQSKKPQRPKDKE
jgi:hypothetical protein